MKLLNNLCKYSFLLVALFSSCSLYAAVADVKVVTLTKVSETRIDRTKYDYVFKVTLKNGSDPLSNVVESLTAVGQGTTIIDGRVVVGDLAENAQATPSDTITLRHDRTYAFNQAALVWNLTSEFPVIASEVTPEKVVTLSTGEKVVKGQLVVMTDEAVSRASLSLLIAKFKGVIVGQIPEVSTYQIELPSNSIESDWLYAKNVLQTSNGILSVSFNTMAEKSSVQPYYPNDTVWSSRPYGSNWDDTAWNMKLIHAPEAWGIAYGGTTTNVKVGVIDGGFKQGTKNNNDELIFEKIYGVTGAIDNISNEMKNNNHGMHVSGIIGANGDNNKGVAGVAWKNTSLYAARTDYSFFNSLTQITRLLSNGVKVINFSVGISPRQTILGVPVPFIRLPQETLDEIFYSHRRTFAIFMDKALSKYDFLFVQSSGNDAETEFDAKYAGWASSVLSDYKPVSYPNSLEDLKLLVNLSNVRAHLISVGAASVRYDLIRYDLNNVVMPKYARSGESVEIVAPGGEECSEFQTGNSYDRGFDTDGKENFYPNCLYRRVLSVFFDAEFGSMKGTSMAAPHVTGAAALVWQVNPNLNAAQVKNILISTAGGKGGIHVIPPSVEDSRSYPVLNLEKAVLKAKETVGIKFQPEAVTTITGQVTCGSNAESMSDIVVQLNNDNAIPVSSIKTDASGVFAFSAKPGKYYLLFWNANSYETVNTQLFTVDANPITFKPIIISSTCGPLETKEIKADIASANTDSIDKFVPIPGKNFSMSKYEVTYAEFDVYAEETGAAKPIDYYGWGRGNLPVMGVNWYEAVAYANWLSQKTGKVYRLPSEEEWEFAARAGTTTNYFWGDDIGVNNAACWNCGTSWDEKAAPVGSFKPNNFGLFDMHGNAWEWTQGCSDTACNFRVLRGGSWNNFPHSLRSITREFQAPISRLVSGGFRLVRDDSAQDNLYGVNFVNVSAGTFTMGLTKQKYYKSPAHTVLVPAFSMSKYAITFDQYDEFANATSRGLPSDNGWGRGNRPVINVSWYDAVAYTEWLSSKTGKKIRLPSDAEWEYAARAGTTTEYYWGDLVGVNNANCNGCGGVWNGSTGTSPVGTFAANPWGLFDMSGNVWQWTQDCDHSDYVGAPTDGSAWTSGGCGNRVYRGGSWDYPSVNMHLAYSNSYPPSVKTGFIGLRVVMEVSN